ncbi:MAG: rhodanese-like domain-containing protein [Thermoanaerobaculia bacterium]
MAPLSDEDKQARIEQLYARSKKLFPEVADLTVDELDRLCEHAPVTLIDVRNPPEQEVSMIPGAITAAEFEADPGSHAGSSLVTYCTVGHRSGLYAQRLQAAGHRVFNLRGAILSWTHAGRVLEDANGPTRRVHVAGPNWSLESSEYDPVW